MSESNVPSSAEISIIAVSESDLRDDEPRLPVLQNIGVQQLSTNLKSFLSQLDQVLDNLNQRVGGFEVDEMEVYAEISAEGKVSLLGTGIQGGATGGIKLILRRPSNSD